MRTKALLIGARAPFQGPEIHIETGKWVIAIPSVELDGVLIHHSNGPVITIGPGDVTLNGPAVISGEVPADFVGPDVFLSIKQVSDA